MRSTTHRGHARFLAALAIGATLGLTACTGGTPAGPTSVPSRPSAPTEQSEPSAPTAPPRTAVPRELVGSWDGGSEQGRGWITFTAGGDVTIRVGRAASSGTVEVAGHRLVIHLSDGRTLGPWPWTVRTTEVYGYTVSALTLNGYGYARA